MVDSTQQEQQSDTGASASSPAFDISPSQAIYVPYYAARACMLAVAVGLGIWLTRAFPGATKPIAWAEVVIIGWLTFSVLSRALSVNFTRYTLDEKRLTIQSGLVGRNVKSVELFRIQDVNFMQNGWQGLFGIGALVILTSDQYHPREVLFGVRDGIALREQITDAATAIRTKAGVHEITVGQ